MKGMKVLLCLLLLVLSLDVEAKSPGKTGATFLKIGVGAKPTAMGEAFCAVADDSYASYWNPAGLTHFETKELSFTHMSWFEDIYYEYLSYISPLQDLKIKIPGIFASSLSYLGINDIKEYGNTKDSYLGTFKAYDLLVNFSYARLRKPNISSGLNLKLIKQKIKSSSSALGIDIGFLYNTPIRNLTGGLTFQNIAFFNNFKDELPFNIKLGSCYKLLKDNLLTLAMDIDIPRDTNMKLHFGAEYLYPEIENIKIAIRLGYKTGVEYGKLGFGVGVNFDKYKFDYAYSSYNDLGNIHQLSFNVKFDESRLHPPTAENKIKESNQVPSQPTSLDSKSNIDFESKEEMCNKDEDIELEDTTHEEIATTENNIEKGTATEKVNEESELVKKEIEEKMAMIINQQEDKIKQLENELNSLRTELKNKPENNLEKGTATEKVNEESGLVKKEIEEKMAMIINQQEDKIKQLENELNSLRTELKNKPEDNIEKEAVIEKVDEETGLIKKEIEEKIATAINEQASKVKELEKELNYLKTEAKEEDNFSKASVSIGGIR